MIEGVPEPIQRFILTSIDSVPHLEAILLLRGLGTDWTAIRMARSLFISESKAEQILDDLCRAGFVAKQEGNKFQYKPVTPELGQMLDELSTIYPRHLIEVSSFIHAKTDRQAQSFGDAFKWKKD